MPANSQRLGGLEIVKKHWKQQIQNKTKVSKDGRDSRKGTVAGAK